MNAPLVGTLLTKIELDALNLLRQLPAQKIFFHETLNPQIRKALNRLQKKAILRFSYSTNCEEKQGIKAEAWQLAEGH